MINMSVYQLFYSCKLIQIMVDLQTVASNLINQWFNASHQLTHIKHPSACVQQGHAEFGNMLTSDHSATISRFASLLINFYLQWDAWSFFPQWQTAGVTNALSLSLSLSHSGTELSHTVPPSTTVWIAMAQWHCPCFCSFTPQIEEEANKH